MNTFFSMSEKNKKRKYRFAKIFEEVTLLRYLETVIPILAVSCLPIIKTANNDDSL